MGSLPRPKGRQFRNDDQNEDNCEDRNPDLHETTTATRIATLTCPKRRQVARMATRTSPKPGTVPTFHFQHWGIMRQGERLYRILIEGLLGFTTGILTMSRMTAHLVMPNNSFSFFRKMGATGFGNMAARLTSMRCSSLAISKSAERGSSDSCSGGSLRVRGRWIIMRTRTRHVTQMKLLRFETVAVEGAAC